MPSVPIPHGRRLHFVRVGKRPNPRRLQTCRKTRLKVRHTLLGPKNFVFVFVCVVNTDIQGVRDRHRIPDPLLCRRGLPVSSQTLQSVVTQRLLHSDRTRVPSLSDTDTGTGVRSPVRRTLCGSLATLRSGFRGPRFLCRDRPATRPWSRPGKA